MVLVVLHSMLHREQGSARLKRSVLEGADGLSPSPFQGSIPLFLRTSPICKERSPEDAVQPSTSDGEILRKRRRRKRRPKKNEVLDSDSDSCDETKSEVTKKEPCELPAPR